MSKSIYVAAAGSTINKEQVAEKIVKELAKSGSVAVFRPIAPASDEVVRRLINAAGTDQKAEDAIGVPADKFAEDAVAAEAQIVKKFGALKAAHVAVVVVGSDYDTAIAPAELDINASLAATLNAPAVVLAGDDATAKFAAKRFGAKGVDVLATADADAAEIAEKLATSKQALRTPAMFEYEINKMAAADKRTIVLPEAEDARILQAAAIVLERDLANIVLLGEADEVKKQAAELGVDVSGAKIVSMKDESYVERYAAKYAELRAHKGVTVEAAREKMKVASYFGTMMIHEGEADGMVSGANNTTANTIRPSLEFIKTKPGVKVVSGAFLMSLADRVLVFADCAVTPNPTPEQLADIAASSAVTARAFGIEPRVALISYSTGTSGAGPDVDAVREATELLAAREPDFAFAGPIQFDAAIDPVVGKKKMPENPVAGNANVFVFPELNTGNTVYKAVQRTAGAKANGPVLQGLKKPVNDLSRGALVDDIVNTIVMTAIQAQQG
ncbi:phosphate acetyltransferase [Propionimicrobium lymphophilum]|uniref:phosphate acetyltransferase n=1 Tax=Propionimicrobium lymphophilum TaxID=33012 RepID=UPI003EC7DD56